MKATKYLMSIL